MKELYEEMSRRFPEIRETIEPYSDLPYEIMGELAHWLDDRQPEEITPELTDRVVAFAKWCEEQPRGKDAGDDLLTILAVGLYERLFKSERARRLEPKLMPRQEIVRNADYFKKWVGEECYKKALAEYDAHA